MLKNRKSGGTCCVGGHAAVGAVAAVGGVAHFTCNFSIWVGHAAGGSCCAFLGGGTCCAPAKMQSIYFPKNIFYDLWSSQRPPASVGLKISFSGTHCS